MNDRMITVKVAGLASGRVTLPELCQALPPSTATAS